MAGLLHKDRWILAALIALMTLAALPVLTYPMGRDQGMYANIGLGILQGKIPFVDRWDIKPPAIYYIYALGIRVFGAHTAAALRAIDLVTVPFTTAGLYWLGRRLVNQRVALLVCIIFPVFYFTETFASLTQSDSIVTMPMTLAVVCALKAADHPRASRRALVWSFAAGALCASTLWFKQYYALFVVVLVIYHIVHRRAIPVKEALAFALGGLPVGFVPLLYFASVGVLREMLIVAQGTARYNAQAFDSLQAFIDQMWNYVVFRWWHWGVLLVLALVWPALRYVERREVSQDSPPDKGLKPLVQEGGGWRLIVLWLFSGLGFVLIQAKGFDTHWLPMLPPLALAGADSTSRLLDMLLKKAGGLKNRTLSIVVYGLAVIAFLGILFRAMWLPALPYLTGRETLLDYYTHFQANDLKPAESLEMVEYLRQHVAPDDTLFIWGFRPEVYYLAGLTPATRFIAHFPLVASWWPPEWRKEAVDALWAALPPYVLVLQSDYMPWVTGTHDDSHTLLVQYSELSDWLAYNYERDTRIGNFLIWRRKS